MKNARKTVKKFKRTYKIKGSPTTYELKRVIEQFGFTTYGYHNDEDKLQETKTYDISTEKPAFTYTKGRKKYVFYNDLLNEADAARVLAHELGHLYYNHMHRHETLFDTGINKEWEANLFAAYLMEPKNIKENLILILISAVVLSGFLLGFHHIKEYANSAIQTSTQPNYVYTQPQELLPEVAEDPKTPADTTVYVAKSGTVYHIDQNCSYIKGHDGIRKMSLESAEEDNLPLCSRCKSKMK